MSYLHWVALIFEINLHENQYIFYGAREESVFSDNENIRTMLTSVRYGFTVLSNLLVYVTTLVVFGTGESQQQVDHDDAESFRYQIKDSLMSIGRTIFLFD